jgi:hypothetical protein
MGDASSGAVPAGGQPPGGSEIDHLIGAIAAPRATFASIARRPTWLLAILLLAGLGTAAIWAGYSKVDPGEFVAYLEAMGRPLPASVSAEQILGWTRVSSAVGAALFAPLTYLVVAAIFLGLLRLAGGELDFRRSLSVTLHGFLPFGVAAVVGLGIAATREEVTMRELESGGLVPSHLGALLGGDASGVVGALASSVDLFSAWCIALLGLGFSIVAGVSRPKAFGAVGAVWGLGILLKLALVALR